MIQPRLILLTLTLGLSAAMVPECPSGPAPSEPGLIVSPATVSFEDVLIYEDTPETASLSVSNVGEVSLTILDINLVDDGSDEGGEAAFAIVLPEELTLAPGAALSMAVQFYPGVAIDYVGEIRIESTDPVQPVILVPLLGAGTRGQDHDGDDVTLEEGDCDDTNPEVYPGANERCDGLDNNCDGAIDEGFGGDGDSPPDCDRIDDDGDGFSEDEFDCDDRDPEVHPITVDGTYDGQDGEPDGSLQRPFRGIQEGLNQSQGCPNVWVHPGTYVENLTYPSWDVSLRSTHGAEVTIVDGAGAAAPVLSIVGPGHGDSRLEGVTLRGGVGVDLDGLTYGGGIYVSEAQPTLMDVVIEGNTVTGSGGGIYVGDGGDVTMEGASVVGNSANISEDGLGGGGIAIEDAGATLVDVIVTGNEARLGGGLFLVGSDKSATHILGGQVSGNRAILGGDGGLGGGIYVWDAEVSLEDVTVADNIADYRGGGLYYSLNTEGVDSIVIADGRFEGNLAGSLGASSSNFRGGAIYQLRGAMDITGTAFEENVSWGVGGGIYLRPSFGGTINEATFIGNTATLFGGGIYGFGTNGIIQNSQFRDNDAPGGGGAITSFREGTIAILGNTFSGNTSNIGGALALYGGEEWVEGNTFTNNLAGVQGGAMLIAYDDVSGGSVGSRALIVGNVMADNEAGEGGHSGFGGAIFISESSPEIAGNDILRNNAQGDLSAGGGIRVSQREDLDFIATPNVHNNIIADNLAWRGGGISVEPGGGGDIWNNTFTGNIGSNGMTSQGGAIFLGTNATSDIRNNILAYSRGGAGIYFDIDDDLTWSITPSLHYNTFYGNAGGAVGGEPFGPGLEAQLDTAPRFMAFSNDGDPSNDILSLGAGSPCINAGDPAAAYDDADGSRNDRGAYGGPSPIN